MVEILRFNFVANMCLSPIQIINPSKYVSLHYRDRYLLSVPCGKCAECQSRKSREWLYRAYVEAKDVLDSTGNSFILFDTLTYDDANLPHLNDLVPGSVVYPCFNHKHITNFFKLLRIRLKRSGFGNITLRYFLSSEYGTDDRYTHRPHYHLLLYVYGNIDPLVLSAKISECWSYGRTDGVPWKPVSYVLTKNVLSKSTTSKGELLRVANYVTKYVQKSCVFQKELDRRLKNASLFIASKVSPDAPDEWLNSVHGRRVMEQLKRSVNQFHRQSLHFGESALSCIDLNELENTGCLVMDHFHGLKINVPLPTYYKRKMFYETIIVDGVKMWNITNLGIEYNKKRDAALLQNVIDRFKAISTQYQLNIDVVRLADYVLNSQGRINANSPSITLVDKLQHVDLFNYAHRSDKEHLPSLGLSAHWLGNNAVGYRKQRLPMMRFSDFISKYVIIDNSREKELSEIQRFSSIMANNKQLVYEEKQRLSNLYKTFSCALALG